MKELLKDYIERNYNKNLEHDINQGDKFDILSVNWIDDYNVVVSYTTKEFLMYPVKKYGTIKKTYHFEHLTVIDCKVMGELRVKGIWFNINTSLKAHKAALKAFLVERVANDNLNRIG
jgi:hypothetical protein